MDEGAQNLIDWELIRSWGTYLATTLGAIIAVIGLVTKTKDSKGRLTKKGKTFVKLIVFSSVLALSLQIVDDCIASAKKAEVALSEARSAKAEEARFQSLQWAQRRNMAVFSHLRAILRLYLPEGTPSVQGYIESNSPQANRRTGALPSPRLGIKSEVWLARLMSPDELRIAVGNKSLPNSSVNKLIELASMPKAVSYYDPKNDELFVEFEISRTSVRRFGEELSSLLDFGGLFVEATLRFLPDGRGPKLPTGSRWLLLIQADDGREISIELSERKASLLTLMGRISGEGFK